MCKVWNFETTQKLAKLFDKFEVFMVGHQQKLHVLSQKQIVLQWTLTKEKQGQCWSIVFVSEFSHNLMEMN